MTKQKAKAAIRQAVATAGILKVENLGAKPVYQSSVNLKYLEGDLEEVVDRLYDELINASLIEAEEPIERWVNVYKDSRSLGSLYGTEQEALAVRSKYVLRTVHLREVVE